MKKRALLFWRSLVQVTARSYQRYRAVDSFRSAAAISYFALLSFLPFLVMTMSALGFLLVALGSGYASQEEFIGTILETTGQVMPFLNRDIADRLRELIQAREAMGAVGAVALIFTSSLVFSAIEQALNGIFEVKKSRHVVKSKLLFVAFVATLGVFTLISHYVVFFADSFITAAGGRPLSDYVYSNPLTGTLLSYVGTVLAFVALISYFCRKRIRFLVLLGGASLFFLLFELAKAVFAFYLTYVAQFSAIYGSLSTFMVLIIWTFYTINIFLFSAAVVRVVSRKGFWYEEEDLRGPASDTDDFAFGPGA